MLQRSVVSLDSFVEHTSDNILVFQSFKHDMLLVYLLT